MTSRRYSWLSRGNATEAAITLPAALGLILLVVHCGFWFSARTTAMYAAHDGSMSAALHESPEPSGVAVTREVLRAEDNGILRDYTVTSRRNPTSVSVTVTGHALSLIPGLELPLITQTSTSPIEEFTP
ncbi:TadE family protein [Devriesea agamarum]|uniref:TadE family protein n=1 Tax=Devriesea agamarum TaxID=472569 RepID=UPI00071DA406|nr:TadE family protein [Devriesea agamarum]